VGVTAPTLYDWRKRFEELGPAALLGHKRSQRGSQLPEPTRRAILVMKQAHPDCSQDRVHDMLIRTEGLEASVRAVAARAAGGRLRARAGADEATPSATLPLRAIQWRPMTLVIQLGNFTAGGFDRRTSRTSGGGVNERGNAASGRTFQCGVRGHP